jgi:hypothetical protein
MAFGLPFGCGEVVTIVAPFRDNLTSTSLGHLGVALGVFFVAFGVCGSSFGPVWVPFSAFWPKIVALHIKQTNKT